MLEQNQDWIAGAAEALAGGAFAETDASPSSPRQKLGKAAASAKTKCGSPSHPHSVAPLAERNPEQLSATEITSEVGGQKPRDALNSRAPDPGIQRINEEWRRRMDFLRARQRLELQAQAICRRYVDGDKTEAAKLWAKVRKDEGHELRVWLQPFITAMGPLDAAKADIEKTLAKLVKELPIYAWAKTVSGFGEVSLAGVIGECGIGPGEYRSVSALWKRMGLAVIGGGRQRKIAGNEAIEHGYNAERRSLVWNIGGCLMKAQLRSLKDESGKKIEGSEYATGELGQVYLDRKAYLRERDPERSAAHIHNDAKRYMEKRLLRQLWQQWRQAEQGSETYEGEPAANPLTDTRKAAQ